MSPYAPPKYKESKKATQLEDEGNEIAATLEQQMLPSGSAAAEVNDLPPAPKTWCATSPQVAISLLTAFLQVDISVGQERFAVRRPSRRRVYGAVSPFSLYGPSSSHSFEFVLTALPLRCLTAVRHV